MAGIVLATRLPLKVGSWLAVSGTSILFALVLTLLRRRGANAAVTSTSRSRYPLKFSILVISAFAFGAARYQYSLPDLTSPERIAFYNDLDYEVRVTGVVSQPPRVQENQSNVKLRVESNQRVGGKEV